MQRIFLFVPLLFLLLAKIEQTTEREQKRERENAIYCQSTETEFKQLTTPTVVTLIISVDCHYHQKGWLRFINVLESRGSIHKWHDNLDKNRFENEWKDWSIFDCLYENEIKYKSIYINGHLSIIEFICSIEKRKNYSVVIKKNASIIVMIH